MAARFRPLSGDGQERPDAPSVPVFGTAPWGYKRAEVDAWMSWVSGLVEHGRKETLRADSAEATLKATLDQLEQLHSLETPGVWPNGTDGPAPATDDTVGSPSDPTARIPNEPADRSDAAGQPDGHAAEVPNGARTPTPLPRRITRSADPSGPSDPSGPGDPPADGGTEPAAPQPTGTAAPAEPASPAGPPTADARTAREPEPRGTTAPDRDPDRPELARLQVVETTLHEVMGLLNRLVESGRGTDRPRDDAR